MGVSEQLPSPECIKTHRGDIKRYLEQANSVLEVLWAILERQLRLAPGTFTKLNSITSPSGTALRMLRYEPQVGYNSQYLTKPNFVIQHHILILRFTCLLGAITTPSFGFHLRHVFPSRE